MTQLSPPTIENLHVNERFRCIETLNHDDIANDVRRIFVWKSALTIFYVLLNIAAVGVLIWIFMSSSGVFEALEPIGLGFLLGFVVLLPIHEYIHAAAYRLVGATNVSVHYQLRNLTAYCVADRNVVAGWNFVVVALAPLVLINLVLVAGLLWLPALRGFIGGMLFLHTAAATGDIALANIIWQRRKNQIWTYDDIAIKKTYFFVEVPR